MKELFIISNESIFERENKHFCDNLDMKSTPEGLSSSFEVNIIARKSLKPRSHQINLKNINFLLLRIQLIHFWLQIKTK